MKQNKVTFNHRKVVNIYLFYGVGASGSNDNDPTLKHSLCGAGRLTENPDIDKYQYSGYGIGFDRRSSFIFPSCWLGQNVVIFGVNISSFVDVDNKKKYSLILWTGPTQG